MFNKLLQCLKPALALTLTGATLAACAPPPAAPTQPDPGTDHYTLDITGVEVRAGEQIAFTGTTTLPEGACLLSELTQDGDLVPWWPGDTCTLISGPTWKINVFLTEPLDEDAQYTLRAWYDEDPEGVADVFYFDLAPPPQGP
ncbi:MAG: hypothetical protein K0B06_11550 [Brevefilum sp.]|nr:hypothetical protein [Brevefilum sp.]